MRKTSLIVSLCLVLTIGLLLIAADVRQRPCPVPFTMPPLDRKLIPTPDSFTSPLQFARDISVSRSYAGSFKQHWYKKRGKWFQDSTPRRLAQATIYIKSVHFSRAFFTDRLSAQLRIGYASWPRAKWLITIHLLDANGKSLTYASSHLDTGGIILSGRVLLMSTDLDLELDRSADLSKAQSFQIHICSANNPFDLAPQE